MTGDLFDTLDRGTCRSCGAPVVWVVTARGKRMPLDPPLVTVVDDDGRTHRGRVSHFATCPDASKHRRKP